MFPNFFTCCSKLEISRKKKNTVTKRQKDQNLESEKFKDPQVVYFHGDRPKLCLRSDNNNIYLRNNLRGNGVKARTKGEMAGSFSDFSDLTLEHGMGGDDERFYDEEEEEEEEEKEEMEMEIVIMKEVFEAISAMKNAYVSLQLAYIPWDPEMLRAADVAVVGRLRRLGELRESYFRRVCTGGDRDRLMKKAVAPYVAAVEELKRGVKARDMEIENLREKVKSMMVNNNAKKSNSSLSKRKIYCSQVLAAPAPELFGDTMGQVKSASQNFTSIVLSLMHTAKWDIPAAVRSIEAASTAADPRTSIYSIIQTQQVNGGNAKHALQSYFTRKLFQGFDHESFHIAALQCRRRQDRFTQYREMKGIMDPFELLDVLPGCDFGKFCSNKYLAIVHPKMEESFFGDLEQRLQVVEGCHPRTQFYGQFLELAKAVWMLHLLAFSINPAPSQFEACRGAEFDAQYMESVVKFRGGRVPSGQVVGFPVSPGFKLGNGSIIKAGVYLVSKN